MSLACVHDAHGGLSWLSHTSQALLFQTVRVLHEIARERNERAGAYVGAPK